MIDYQVIDVFTDKMFGGNQLAVILDASEIPEPQLQAIAREFNFSEVTFVYPPERPGNTARVRIFTPTTEIPFAGHPTIGTAIALAVRGAGPDMVLELGVGDLECRATETEASFCTVKPLDILARPDPSLVARTLDLPLGALKTDRHVPTLCSLGLGFTVTEVQDRAALAAVGCDMAGYRTGQAAYPESMDFAQYVYFKDGDQVHARMFAPLDGIPEDPATGSAAATLAALTALVDKNPVNLTVHQGHDMGRPSRIKVTADDSGVTVSGQAVKVMQGQLML